MFQRFVFVGNSIGIITISKKETVMDKIELKKTCYVCKEEITSGSIHGVLDTGHQAYFCMKRRCFKRARRELRKRIAKELGVLYSLGKCAFTTIIGWCREEGFPFCHAHTHRLCDWPMCNRHAVAECSEEKDTFGGPDLCGSAHCDWHQVCPEHNYGMWLPTRPIEEIGAEEVVRDYYSKPEEAQTSFNWARGRNRGKKREGILQVG